MQLEACLPAWLTRCQQQRWSSRQWIFH
uniref:Uncharacterized protein n=1 Tax=Zea mays TaxID=4577 RepID=B4FJC6_MAIZE|nr:unknown [Zea mays]